ncbi:MAG: element excision factor XisI family protein [Bacteroidota bacterium]
MERIERYRKIIRQVIARPASSKTINQPSLQKRLLVDESKNNYLLFNIGWHQNEYVYDLLFHIELTESGMVCILENNTDYPLEDQLLGLGIEKKDLQLAWTKEEPIFSQTNDKKQLYRNVLKDLVHRMASATSLNAPNLKKQAIVDENSCNFALFSSGWHEERYIYDLLLSMELKENQIWIHENNTDYPIEEVLMKAGVEGTDIILAWNPIAASDERNILVTA